MGRLIDDNLLKKGIKKWLKPSKPDEDEYISITDALVSTLQEIEEQPTAYDPDKVVEQLEELKSLVPVNRILEDIVNEKPKELGMLIAYEKAIEIVKGGVVDGN